MQTYLWVQFFLEIFFEECSFVLKSFFELLEVVVFVQKIVEFSVVLYEVKQLYYLCLSLSLGHHSRPRSLSQNYLTCLEGVCGSWTLFWSRQKKHLLPEGLPQWYLHTRSGFGSPKILALEEFYCKCVIDEIIICFKLGKRISIQSNLF